MVPVKQFLAVAFVVMVVAPAAAQDPAGSGVQSQPALNADAFRLPSSAYNTTKPKSHRTAPAPDSFKPGQFDLGDSSVLQFDAKRDGPSNRVGIETMDSKQLGGIRRDDSKPLNYFGMTLSKPLN
ncbi:MAG: hypothetical protein ACTHLO_20730 [Pseudolabrys sp.]